MQYKIKTSKITILFLLCFLLVSFPLFAFSEKQLFFDSAYCFSLDEAHKIQDQLATLSRRSDTEGDPAAFIIVIRPALQGIGIKQLAQSTFDEFAQGFTSGAVLAISTQEKQAHYASFGNMYERQKPKLEPCQKLCQELVAAEKYSAAVALFIKFNTLTSNLPLPERSIAPPEAPLASPLLGKQRIFDDAGLLTPAEVAKIQDQLTLLSDKYNAHFFIITRHSLEGSNIDQLTGSTFLQHAEGHDSGAVLAVAMQEREVRYQAWGTVYDRQKSLFSDIRTAIGKKLSASQYYEAFSLFVELNSSSGFTLSFMYNYHFSFLAALLITIFSTIYFYSARRGQHAVNPKTYATPSSFKLTGIEDRFTHTTTTRTRIQKSGGRGGRGGGGGRTGGSSGRF